MLVIRSGRSRNQTSSQQSNDYRLVFLTHVHQLLNLGYNRMKKYDYSNQEETAITGDLVKYIDEVLDYREHGWMQRYSVHDDPAVNDGRRKGSSRKRIDIRIDSSVTIPRTRFSFEAKRLNKTHSVSVYLGLEGLGCFLGGEYAAHDDSAGMLGYIQAGTVLKWAQKIEDKLAKEHTKYMVLKDAFFRRHAFKNGPSDIYHSGHARSSGKGDIENYHTLLVFC